MYRLLETMRVIERDGATAMTARAGYR